MALSMDRHFADAAGEWSVEQLYADLASTKRGNLTPTEKVHLRGLLCGCSPGEIAQELGKVANGVETDLSATIYKYVKELVGKPDGRISSWRDIAEWLEAAGYKSAGNLRIEDLQTDKTSAHVTNINIEKNQLVFMISVTVPTKRSDDSLK